MNTVGERIRQRREQLRMTQAELGERVGMTQQGVATLESPERETKRPRFANEIARTLDVSVDWLLYGEEKRREEPMRPIAERVRERQPRQEELSQEALIEALEHIAYQLGRISQAMEKIASARYQGGGKPPKI